MSFVVFCKVANDAFNAETAADNSLFFCFTFASCAARLSARHFNPPTQANASRSNAATGGCNLFDLDQLSLGYSPAEYQNLLMCEFVDDTASVFPFAELQSCMVDTMEEWDDFHHFAARPFGYRPVWPSE